MGDAGRDPVVLLEEMVEELQFLEEATKGVDEAQYLGDGTLRRATERALEILGEAAKAVPEDVKRRHDDIPWSGMAQMRDLLIHAYHRVEPEIVWSTIHSDALPILPDLREVLEDERTRHR